MINLKNLDPNKTKIYEKSYKNILICYIGYVTIENLSYVTVNSVNPLYLIISKINGTLKKAMEIGICTKNCGKKIRDLIRSITNNSGNYDEKFMKIKFHSNDDLPLKKTIELYNTVKIVRSVFYVGSKCYPQVF